MFSSLVGDYHTNLIWRVSKIIVERLWNGVALLLAIFAEEEVTCADTVRLTREKVTLLVLAYRLPC